MTGQVYGVVAAVEAARQGVIATGWAGAQLAVQSAADIDRDGCDLTPDDGQTIYRCTGEVVDGLDDGDPDVVTMTSGPPAGWPTGGVDADGQDIPVEVRLDVWPEVLDVVAQVETADGATLPVTVPHALRPLLSEGIRDPDDREQVRLEWAGGGWQVADVIGRRAQVGMDGLAPDVVETIAAASASGLHRWDSINPPNIPGSEPGDMWFQHAGVLSGQTVGQWHWDGGQWVQDTLADAVLGNVDAGKIVGGTLSGLAGLYSPAPDVLPRTEIVGPALRVVRAGAEGEEIVTVQVGGESDDQLMVADTDGSPLGGIDPDGNLLAQDANVGTLTVGGVALPDMLSPLPQGLVARQNLGSTAAANGLKFNSNELGTSEIMWDCWPGRIYKVRFVGMMNLSAGGVAVARLRGTSTPNHTSAPSAPTLSSPQYAQQNVVAAAAGVFPVTLECFVGPYDGTYRMGVSGQTSDSGLVGNFLSNDNWPSQLTVEDVGCYTGAGDGGVNTMGGTPAGGNPSTGGSSTKTYTRSWSVAAFRTWRGSQVVSGNLMQGVYSGIQRYGLWLFDGSIAAAVGASATVSGAWLTVQNVDFPMNPGGSGLLRLGHYDSTSLPANPQTSGGGAVQVAMSGGQKLKIGLPGGWWSGIAAGMIRGFTLGEGASSAVAYYGHFSPTATLTLAFSK